MSAPSGGPGAVRPPWLIDRDLDAVAAHLDPWILAAEPHDNAATTTIPLLGRPSGWPRTRHPTRSAKARSPAIASGAPDDAPSAPRYSVEPA